MTKFQKRVLLFVVTVSFIAIIVFLKDDIELPEKVSRLNFAKTSAESEVQSPIKVKIKPIELLHRC